MVQGSVSDLLLRHDGKVTTITGNQIVVITIGVFIRRDGTYIHSSFVERMVRCQVRVVGNSNLFFETTDSRVKKTYFMVQSNKTDL